MFKRLLLAGTAGVIVIAGALDAGAAWSQESEDSSFVFRYSPGVLSLVATAGDESDESEKPEDGTEGPADPDGGDQTEEPIDPGAGDTDEPTDPEMPGGVEGDEDGDGIPTEGSIDGLSFRAEIYLASDANGNGYADYWDQVRIRGIFTNTTADAIGSIKASRRISFMDFSDTSSWSIASLAPGETKSLSSSSIYLSYDQVAYLAAGYRFEGYVSVTQAGALTYAEGEYPADVTTAEFGIYDPLLPENIAVSEPTAEHIDGDGDGEGDRSEVVRVSFKAKNTGGVAASDVSFEIGFAGWPAATSYCDRASLLPGSTMSCSVDIELTKEYLATLGEPGTAATLNGAISLVALTSEHFASGVHQTPLNAVSFAVPQPVYANFLQVVATDGWAFECRTTWTPEYMDANREMYLTQYKDGAVIPAGGWANPYGNGGIYTSWMLISVDFNTVTTATARPMASPRNGDPRPFLPEGTPPPCITDYGVTGDMAVVSQGDHRNSYYITVESVDVVRREI